MLITYVSVAVCLASFVALLISRSSPRSKIRLRNRAIVAPRARAAGTEAGAGAGSVIA
ncbi:MULTISPECIES: hypothetical protein [unclassified Streptomyces]|uniref:hypothetical protein n=1 Tax=unclassified Streptomyces TaxID=2593676 RepID=UPI002E2C39EC|nr:hypothetical protein [Streptomyces sp. NBC_01439]